MSGEGRPKNVDAVEFYNLLELDKSSSDSEIAKAYRRLALVHHPDKGGDPEHFKKIARAYEVLKDGDQRAKYDKFGEHGLESDTSVFEGGRCDGTTVPAFPRKSQCSYSNRFKQWQESEVGKQQKERADAADEATARWIEEALLEIKGSAKDPAATKNKRTRNNKKRNSQNAAAERDIQSDSLAACSSASSSTELPSEARARAKAKASAEALVKDAATSSISASSVPQASELTDQPLSRGQKKKAKKAGQAKAEEQLEFERRQAEQAAETPKETAAEANKIKGRTPKEESVEPSTPTTGAPESNADPDSPEAPEPTEVPLDFLLGAGGASSPGLSPPRLPQSNLEEAERTPSAVASPIPESEVPSQVSPPSMEECNELPPVDFLLRAAPEVSTSEAALQMKMLLEPQKVAEEASDLETKADEVRTALQFSLSTGPGLPTVPAVSAASVTLRPPPGIPVLDFGEVPGLDMVMELELPDLEVETSLEEGRRHVAPLATITLSSGPTAEPAIVEIDDFGAPSPEEIFAELPFSQAADTVEEPFWRWLARECCCCRK